MKIESLMWLFPIMFMIHDFEEIIFARPWLNKHAPMLQARFPAAAGLIGYLARLSTSAFAVAVAEEFVLFSAITYVCVEYQLYNWFAGMIVAYFVHLILHVLQFVLMRRYVPVIVTSVLTAPYCLYTLAQLDAWRLLDWNTVMVAALILGVGLVANLILCHIAASRFDRWLHHMFGSELGASL